MLNPEVDTVLNETAKRDRFLALDQSLCGATMSALGSLISDIILRKDGFLNRGEIVQCLSDASRLQCELMHQLSKARRALIYLGFKKEAKTLLEKTKAGSYLFGTDWRIVSKRRKVQRKQGCP